MKPFCLFVTIGMAVGLLPAQESWPEGFGAEGFTAMLVWQVKEGGHGDECGLKPWDLLIRVDDVWIDSMSPDAFSGWLRSMPAGHVQVEYLQPTSDGEEFSRRTTSCAVPTFEIHSLAVFLVTDVPAESEAAAWGFQRGDFHVGGRIGGKGVWRRNPLYGQEGEEYMNHVLLTKN